MIVSEGETILSDRMIPEKKEKIMQAVVKHIKMFVKVRKFAFIEISDI